MMVPCRCRVKPAWRTVSYERRSGAGNTLGWASKELGRKIGKLVEAQQSPRAVRQFLNQIYSVGKHKENLTSLSDDEVLTLAKNLRQGVPFANTVLTAQQKLKSKPC